MKLLETLLNKVSHIPGSALDVEYRDEVIQVGFPDQRSQRIYVERNADHYVFWSRVIGKARVDKLTIRELAEAIWTRNRQTDVVEFTLDTQGRLIGRIRQIAETLDVAELFCISVLSRECDRFE